MSKFQAVLVIAASIGLGVAALRHPANSEIQQRTGSPAELATAGACPEPAEAGTALRPLPAVPILNTNTPAPNDAATLTAAILDGLNGTNEDERNTAINVFFPRLIELDPLAAADLAAKTAPESGQDDLLRQAIQGWVAKDNTAALAWAEQLADTNVQKTTLVFAAIGMATENPQAAVDMAISHQMRDDAVIVDLVMQWERKDALAAQLWVENQPAGTQRDEMLERIAFVKSKDSPVEAASLVAEKISPGPVQDDAALSVLYQWALRDLASAKRWANDFPPGPLRDRAFEALALIEPTPNDTP